MEFCRDSISCFMELIIDWRAATSTLEEEELLLDDDELVVPDEVPDPEDLDELAEDDGCVPAHSRLIFISAVTLLRTMVPP